MAQGGFAGKTEGYFNLTGRNIIEGFKRLGYKTIGSAAVGWFDPETETGQILSQDFDAFYYSKNTYSLHKQLKWLSQHLQDNQPKFVFLNVGEIHVPYYCQGATWEATDNPCIPFGENNRREDCEYRQKLCLRYVDLLLEPLLKAFSESTVLICADHGDCWGEDGLWEHGFYHPKVLEVPLIFRLGKSKILSSSMS
jgi:glucan phosphoethanolaminetransferase (alkaline phosphatase superfamily)